jgi:hypothetical protein
MVDSVVCEVSSLRNSDGKLSDKKGDTCHYCGELMFELHKAKLVILSFEKVIKFLQDELSNNEVHTQPDLMKQKYYYNEQLQDPASKDDWIEVTLNKYKN